MKKNLVAGNWKMYKTPQESISFAKNLKEGIKTYNDRDILICPPFTSLFPVYDVLRGTPIKLGAQNVYFEEEGAFTGEISTRMLKESGVSYVICGHSERRNIFMETDEVINKKIKKTISDGMTAILCIGEKLEERENGETFNIIKKQIYGCLNGINHIENIVIAYEPVWAIGTGKNATPEQAEEVHFFIRELIEKSFGKESAEKILILYGGSVKPENIDSLMAQKDIDGVLVGGASLKIESFLRIIDYNTSKI
ncbi:MAG: triose-phosphate isomerase [bacterium]|nr:triose-phosphate isomerase [bacterium]